MEIISAKYLLTMTGKPIIGGAIAVENGEIIDVGKESDLISRYKPANHEDYSQHVLLPGLINAHIHLDMTHHKNFMFDPVRQLAVEANFIDWLITCIEYKKKRAPDQLKNAVDEGLEACIESGTTCVGDMGSFEGIFQSIEQKGIRAVVFPEILSYDSNIAKDLYETALAIVDKYMDFDSDLVHVGVGPYSPYTLSRNILRIMSQYSNSSQLPLMMHVVESFAELEFFYNSTGDIAQKLFPNIGWGESLPPAFRKTPIEYLDEIRFLDCQPILVGCVHVTPSDLDRMAEKKVKVVWCPRSNYYLKLGEAKILKMKEKGIKIALGTDGISSTNTLSLWDELRFAFEITGRGQKVLTSDDLMAMVTKNAAEVLGVDDEVGTLEIGKRADYIVVKIDDVPDHGDLCSHLIQKTKGYHVHKVVVNGQTLKMVN